MPATEKPATPSDAEADLELLRAVAVEAGQIAMRYFGQRPEVWMKLGQSPVSEADFAVDNFLKEKLLSARPDYGWLSEETADTAERLGRPRTFVVDPIDGTRGFLEGRDVWCVSIAVVEAGHSIVGVLECPARNETFWAVPGGGAFKNGAALSVQYPGPNPTVGGPKMLLDLLPQPLRGRLSRVHHVPSLAYRVAMIADAAMDATFIKPNAHDWDLAAADLILREAGGEIRDGKGERPVYCRPVVSHGVLLAGSGDLLETMVAALAADETAPVSNRANLI